jgi:hypothetical protein
MNKSDAGTLGTQPGLIVDQAHASIAQLLERLADIIDPQRDVM